MKCETCVHFKEWTESHPYGSTTARESHAECGQESPFLKEDGKGCDEYNEFEPGIEVENWEDYDE